MSAPHVTTPTSHGSASDVPGRRRHWWRWVAGVVVVLLVGFLAAAWYFSGRIYSGALASEPYTYPPPYDEVRISSVADGRVTLDTAAEAAPSFDAPSSYGLVWDGGTGFVGPARTVDADTVVRDFTPASGTTPATGALADLDRRYWVGPDPSGLGIPWSEVTVDGPDGALPAWYFPGDGDVTTTAVVVHGQNGSRLDGLRVVDTVHAAGMPALVITYRNDAGAPADPSGRLGYGATEWPDLEAAVSWATTHGASDVVLVGQSMGGAVVASFLEHSSSARSVSRVVLDAPMLSLHQAVQYGAREAMPGGYAVPGPLLWAAERVAALRYGLDWTAVDYLDDTSWVTVPTLVTHGAADSRVPVTVSEQLGSAVPDLVTVRVFPRADHVESWNTDRAGWTQLVSDFLAQAD